MTYGIKKCSLFLTIFFIVLYGNKSYAADKSWDEEILNRFTDYYDTVESDTIEFKYDNKKQESVKGSASELGILNYYFKDINDDSKEDFIVTILSENEFVDGKTRICLESYVYLAYDETPTFSYSWSFDNHIYKKCSLMLKRYGDKLYYIMCTREGAKSHDESLKEDMIHIFEIAGEEFPPFLYAYSEYREGCGETLYMKDYINEPDSTDFMLYSSGGYFDNAKFEELEIAQNCIKEKLMNFGADNLMTISPREEDTSISFMSDILPNDIMPIVTLEQMQVEKEGDICSNQIKINYRTLQEQEDVVRQLKITPKVEVKVNQKEKIEINDINGKAVNSNDIEWIIDDEKIARLEFLGDSVEIVGIKSGITCITAKIGDDISAKCEVVVLDETKADIEKQDSPFYKDSKGLFRYNGNIIESNKKYTVEGDLVLDRTIEIPSKAKIYVMGDIQINCDVVCNSDLGKKSSHSKKDAEKFCTLSCTKNLKVDSKGIIDLSRGGNIVIGEDFDFNSSVDHTQYLYNGIIMVKGDLNFKKNFYASEGNEIQIICEEEETHSINIKKNWFKPVQSLGILHVVDGGLEMIDIEKNSYVRKLFLIIGTF